MATNDIDQFLIPALLIIMPLITFSGLKIQENYFADNDQYGVCELEQYPPQRMLNHFLSKGYTLEENLSENDSDMLRVSKTVYCDELGNPINPDQ